MTFENRIRMVLKNEAEKIQPHSDMKERIFSKIETGNKRVKMTRKRLVAGIIAACLLIPTASLAGYSYIADQIWGSSENIKQIGGTQEDYDRFESKLIHAKETLSLKEFTQFIVLLKDMAYYHLKMADMKGNLHPERLSSGERAEYEQLKKEIEPFFDKLNKALTAKDGVEFIPVEEAQSVLSFPVKHPAYIPDGYKLVAKSGLKIKDKIIPHINMQYKKDNESILILLLQSERNQPQSNMLHRYDHISKYSLKGYKAMYGEGSGNGEGYNGIMLWIPKTNKYGSYEIYVTGKLEKTELEKIALSILE
jgi:hypothetical protein